MAGVFQEIEDDNVDEKWLDSHMNHIINLALAGAESPGFSLSNTVPTHTEDGIPIRKLYIANLPPKTRRSDLFGVYSRYGIIKSCWLKMGDRGSNKKPSPTYAFITFNNPEDAHKALEAPYEEKMLRERYLRTFPADTWHQPIEDAEGCVHWNTRSYLLTPHHHNNVDRKQAGAAAAETASEQDEQIPGTSGSETEVLEMAEKAPEEYNILDILNGDCLTHILSYVPIKDLILSERVSKRWQTMVQEHIQSTRVFKTSWWHGKTLTTAVLRCLLGRMGGGLQRLVIDNPSATLNDRIAHIIGKYCPNLTELKVFRIKTRNWNSLMYRCKQLKNLSYISCGEITDTSLVHTVDDDSSIESIMVANNTHVTGLFLTMCNPPNLHSVSLYNCYNLQGSVLVAAMSSLHHLTTLKLDACPASIWEIIPTILKKLPGLKELSLSESFVSVLSQEMDFCESFAYLTELRVLKLFMNVHVTDAVLKAIARSCAKLEALDISCCNAMRNSPGVTDEGLLAISSRCVELTTLDVSYLHKLSDFGLRDLPRLQRLEHVVARGNPALSAAPFAAALANCHLLKEVDLCGSDNVSEEVAVAAARALDYHPRRVLLRLAGTAATPDNTEDIPRHKLLTVDVMNDLSKPSLRPDFIDHAFELSSEDEFDDYNDFDVYLGENIYFVNADGRVVVNADFDI